MEAGKNTIDALQSKTKNSFLQVTKLAAYELLFNLFDSEVRHHNTSKAFQKVKFGFINLLQAMNMIGILLEDPSIDNWESYSLIWNIFLLSKLDYLFAYTHYYKTASIALQSSLICLIFLCIYLAFSIYKGKSPRNYLFQIAKTGSALYVRIIPIPFLKILLNQMLFRSSPQQPSPFYIPLTLIALLCFTAVYYLYTTGSAEIRHSYRDERIDSRNCSDLEFFTFKIRFLLIAYLILNGKSSYSGYITIIGETLIAYKAMKGLFYYNAIATVIKTVCSLLVACSAFSLVIAMRTNDSAVCVLLFLFFSPIVIVGVMMKANFTTKSSEELIEELIKQPYLYSSHLEVEKVLRPFLCNRNHRELVLNAFSSCFLSSAKSKHELMIIWETNFCVTVLEDERLGKIKLSKRLTTDFSLEGDYQAFFCMKWLEFNSKKYYEEVDFLYFRIELEKNKRRDKELCLNYYDLMQSLMDNNSSNQKIDELLKELSESIQRVDEVYDLLCKTYSKNKEIVFLYISFLKDVANDQEKAVYLEQKHGHDMNNQNNEQLNYFDESNAVMIVSGEYSSVGVINYANDNICELLKEQDLTGRNLNDFIPQQFQGKHNSFLKRYVFSCTKTKINVPNSVMLCNNYGYLIEVYIKIKCVALDSYPFFLAFFKRKRTNREVAIMNPNGIITNHTEGIPKILKIRSKNVVGFDLEDHIMNKGSCEFGDGHAYYILNNYKVLLYEKKIFSSMVSMYRFFSQDSSLVKAQTLGKPKKASLVRDIAKHDEQRFNTIKKINFLSEKGTLTLEDSQNKRLLQNLVQPKNESVSSEKEHILAKFENNSSLTVLMWSISSLILLFIIFTVANCIYVMQGLDSNLIFTSLYKTYGLRYFLVQIANDARNLDLVGEEFEHFDNIFRDMENYQIDLVELLEDCDKHHKVYEYEMYYWDDLEIKRINLLDFANKFTSNMDEYFEGRETVNSYKFIVKNANSFPYEYFQSLIEQMDSCVDSQLSMYDFLLSLQIVTQIVLISANLFIMTIAALKVRRKAQVHWRYLIDIMCKNHIQIHSNLLARLEMIHNIPDMSAVFKPLTKSVWSIPRLSMFSYVWRSLVVGGTFLVFIMLFYIFAHQELIRVINTRRDTIFSIGESAVNMQDLDFWTRETMFEGSLSLLLNDINPLKSPPSKLREVHKNIELLSLSIQKNKDKIFTSSEFDLFFDRQTFEGHFHPAGIYGAMKTIVMDSFYYSVVKIDREKEYSKFLHTVKEMLNCKEQFFLDSAQISDDLVDEYKEVIFFLNCAFCVAVIVLILFVFINFIRKDKQIIEHKKSILKVLGCIR